MSRRWDKSDSPRYLCRVGIEHALGKTTHAESYHELAEVIHQSHNIHRTHSPNLGRYPSTAGSELDGPGSMHCTCHAWSYPKYAFPESCSLLQQISQKYLGRESGVVYRKPKPNEILFEYYVLKP